MRSSNSSLFIIHVDITKLHNFAVVHGVYVVDTLVALMLLMLPSYMADLRSSWSKLCNFYTNMDFGVSIKQKFLNIK